MSPIRKAAAVLAVSGALVTGGAVAANAATTGAIREYQHMMGLKETGEPTKALFESLTEMRKIMAPASAAAN